MPRPGPRPYECVRKIWHSDRHQPIRGSVIQEMFRVVNQIHSLNTRKTSEWQEKLPIVVLKAEEIIYSKANSEEEYMDMDTLWDRTNDAINTIIRKDESSETGELLHPCIEAALVLGCIPNKTSRTNKHSVCNYLSSSSNGFPLLQHPCMHNLNSIPLVPHAIQNGSTINFPFQFANPIPAETEYEDYEKIFSSFRSDHHKMSFSKKHGSPFSSENIVFLNLDSVPPLHVDGAESQNSKKFLLQDNVNEHFFYGKQNASNASHLFSVQESNVQDAFKKLSDKEYDLTLRLSI